MAQKPEQDAIHKEIADLKKEILRYKQTEQRFQIMAANIDQVFWMTAPQSAQMIYVSPAYERIWGRSVEELYANPHLWLESVIPEDVAAVKKTWDEQLKGNSTYEEFRIHRADGTICWIANRAYPVIDANGQVAYITGVATDISDRKAAQEASKAMAERWQATFDAVQNSVCILDTDWTIIQANQATVQLLNRPIEEIIGHKCYELIHGTLEPVENCPIRSLTQDSQRETEELQLGNRWIEVAADPIVNREGHLEGFVHIIADVNERKQAEEALKKNQSTLQSIFKAAPTGIGMVCNRILTQVNERLCEMIGYSPEELIDQSARILYPSDDDYEFVGTEKYAQISAHGTGTVETRWQHKNGEILDILLSSTPLNIEDWSEGVTFTALDITERKKTEKALRASHQMFLTVLDGIDATIYVADMDTYEILFMNKFMQESFGQDFTGQICWKVFRNEDGPCEHCTNDKLLDSQGKPSGVYVWQDRNPVTNKWYINYDRAIEWVDGRIVRIQIATDITEMKRLEAQLHQSQKLEAIGNLAGGIAHDFNNILSAVIGYTELSLADAEPGSTLQKSLKEILRAGVRAKDLVKHILTFARRADEELKPVMVSAVAREVLKLLRSTLPVSIEMQTSITSDSMVMADPSQLHQIFMNLCTNAAHAMESTGGTLKVSLSDVELTSADRNASLDLLPGPYVKLVIEDTGVGIPLESLNSIFEPYFTTKPKGEGTGLGLSIVHGIVKGYNGEILVDSSVGHGTVFTIFLPITGSPADEGPPLALNFSKGNERILFVDDEQPICEMGAQVLKRLGYQVTARTSSVEALALFKAKPDTFDLVITDMTMPNLTGDKLAAELIQVRPDIPVILCTGYSKVMSEEKAAAIGIKAFAMKPLTIEDLSKTIRDVLEPSDNPEA